MKTGKRAAGKSARFLIDYFFDSGIDSDHISSKEFFAVL
jgi:hypothetical protein